MLKSLMGSVFGSRHERERKRVQPIVDETNAHYARLQSVSEAELQAQTAKVRATIQERTSSLRAQIDALREKKRVAAEPAKREEIDLELGGADGQGGLERDYRAALNDVLDEMLPEAFATVREAARRLLGTPVM